MVSSLNFPPKMMMYVGRETAALLLKLPRGVQYTVTFVCFSARQGQLNDDEQLTEEAKGHLAGYDLDISVDSVNDQSCLQASSRDGSEP